MANPDLAFSTDDDIEATRARIGAVGAVRVVVTQGPVQAFGAAGWGESLYSCDPSGNGIEIIHYPLPPPVRAFGAAARPGRWGEPARSRTGPPGGRGHRIPGRAPNRRP